MMKMQIEEICAKLRPIYGPRIDRLWAAYLTEDRTGREEIEAVLRLLYVQATSEGLDRQRILLLPPPARTAEGDYQLGQVLYNGRPCYPFGLREGEILQHCAIFGRSGSGKTNAAFVLLEGLLKRAKPFLIFDWKRNYRDILAESDRAITVFTVGRDVAPFSFNPLIPPPGTQPTTHLKKLIEIVAGAYYLGEGVMYLLQKALDAVYEEWGVYRGPPAEYPTMADVLTWLEAYPAKGREANWMSSTLRAVGTVCFGEMGRVVNVRRQRPLERLLEENVILELDALTNSDKTFFIESFLLWIHHLRLAEPSREVLKHVILIEEAHHILHKQETGGEGVVDTLLREIRELGEGIILIDQHPSLISLPAMGNTFATICLNLKHSSDVSTAANCMLLGPEEKEYLGRLPVGQAMVKLQDRWFSTFLIQVPWRKIQKGAVDDTALRGRHRSDSADSTQKTSRIAESPPGEAVPEPAKEGSALSGDDRRMIADIAAHPFSGVAHRYDRLQVSRRKGTAIKQGLTELGLITEEGIPTRSGKTVLLCLTEEGLESARQLGIEVGDVTSRAGILHEYWRHVVRDYFEARGYEVEEEKHIPGNGALDLEARRSGDLVAIEIETGKSDAVQNVRKALDAGYERILVVAVDAGALESVGSAIRKAGVASGRQVDLRLGADFGS